MCFSKVVTAIVQGSLEGVRAVLMAALVASLGFVPMALATHAGVEVRKPFATVVIVGLVTSTALPLLSCPPSAARSQAALPDHLGAAGKG